VTSHLCSVILYQCCNNVANLLLIYCFIVFCVVWVTMLSQLSVGLHTSGFLSVLCFCFILTFVNDFSNIKMLSVFTAWFYASVVYAVVMCVRWLSVHPSQVKSSTKTAKHNMTQTMPHNSSGYQIQVDGVKLADFDQYLTISHNCGTI